MKKEETPAYDLEERLLDYGAAILLTETDQLIRIFITSIRTAKSPPQVMSLSSSILLFFTSMFDVGRSMFDVPSPP